MTHEEINKASDDLCKGVRMMLDKLTATYKDYGEMDLCEMGRVADIMKDLAEAHKNLVKVHWMLSEKPMRKY